VRRLAASAALAFVVVRPGSAGAEGAIEIQARGGHLSLQGVRARSDDRPSVVRDAVLDASGAFRGVGFRALGWDRTFRAGFQQTYLWSDAVNFSSAPLPAGYTAETRSFWGTNLELFLGGQGGTRNVVLYGELRLALYLLQTRVALRSEAGGFLGDTRYLSVRGDVGPRLGLKVSLTRSTYLDTAIQVSILGPERFASALGLGAVF
jgi:hypothetical protein